MVRRIISENTSGIKLDIQNIYGERILERCPVIRTAREYSARLRKARRNTLMMSYCLSDIKNS
jgi:hypothetical protein